MTSYQIIVTPPARKNLNGLPLSVQMAVLEFIYGPLANNPQRVGKLLRGEFEGLHSARRGAYRIIYRIIEQKVEVEVVRLGSRADFYRR